jgi:phospholipase/lecithinase/hemolysin
MKKFAATLATICLSATMMHGYATSVALKANPLGIDQLFVFGDSLSDEGVQTNNPNVVDPKEPIYTITGGHVWPTYLATLLGIAAPTANNEDFAPGLAYIDYNNPKTGTDYAAGGSTTSGPGYNAVTGQYEPPSLISYIDEHAVTHEGQINYFIRTHQGTVDINGLYVVWAGSNDLFQEISNIISEAAAHGMPSEAQLTADLSQTVSLINSDLIKAVTQLHNAGAQHIMVLDLADLADTPRFIGLLNQLPAAYRIQFLQALEGLAAQIKQSINVTFGEKTLGFKVYAVDVVNVMDQLYQQIVIDHGSYSFSFNGQTYKVTNFLTPLCPGNNADALYCTGFTPSTYDPVNNAGFYADGVHPSPQGHQLLANAIYNRLLAG